MKKFLILIAVLMVSVPLYAFPPSPPSTAGTGDMEASTYDTGSDGAVDKAESVKSPATTGVITVTGPGAGTTRVKTVRDANDTVLELGGSYTPTGTWTWTSTTWVGAPNVSDTVYGATWDAVTTISPSKKAVYDKIESVIAGYPTQASLHVDSLITLSGVADDAVNLGSFTGSTIEDNQTVKAALQALETSGETKVSTSSVASYTEPVSNLPLCRTGAGTIGGCSNVTDVAFSSYAPLANPQFTGVVDIPVDATTDAEGEQTIDTTTNQFRYYGGAQRVLSPIQHSSIVITAPADTDDINIMKAPYGMTILGINCIVQGTTSATGQLQECSATGGDCADLDSDIACDADGAADDGTLTDSAIAANAWLRWKTTSLSGTPTFLTVTFRYLVVAD